MDSIDDSERRWIEARAEYADQLEEELRQLRAKDDVKELVVEANKMKCPKCDGTGKNNQCSGDALRNPGNCPHCDGAGEIGEGQWWKVAGTQVGWVSKTGDSLSILIGNVSWRLTNPQCPRLLARMKEVE